MHENVITNSEIVPKKSHLKVSGGLQSQRILTAWPFSSLLSVYRRLFLISSVDLEMGVHSREDKNVEL